MRMSQMYFTMPQQFAKLKLICDANSFGLCACVPRISCTVGSAGCLRETKLAL